jgi:hypothetical protein
VVIDPKTNRILKGIIRRQLQDVEEQVLQRENGLRKQCFFIKD